MTTFRKGQLLDILEDLSDKEMKRFWWHLKDTVLDDLPSIPYTENAERHDTVDTMVETYGINRALKITVEIFKEMRRSDLAVKMEAKWRAGLSDEHKQKLTEELQTTLKLLDEKVKKFKEVKQTYIQSAGYFKTQAKNTKRNIKEEFKKLHKFLQEEEKARIAAVTKEQKQRSEKMKEMDRERASLSDTIKALKKELRTGDISFLQNLKTTEQRDQGTPDPQLDSAALIDVAKHLGNLAFRVWEKMKGVVKFSPVILDPNTAHPELSVSDDLTRVTRPNTKKQLPDNPERFTDAYLLGSEGFSSGKHSWGVEVGDHPRWSLGIAKESVKRKGEISVSPEYGIWCVRLESGKVINGLGETLSLKRRPQRITVQLDCDKGEVSFYDSEDMTLIYTHADAFTEKLYPFFGIGQAGDAKLPDVTILPSELHVLV